MDFDRIIKETQYDLKRSLRAELRGLGYKWTDRAGFLYAEGKIPILLVAHLDTVHKQPVKTICKSDNGIWMSPQGIGGDDRCGVFIILELIKKTKCHVLFCEDEEIGCAGARKFVKSGIIPEVNYIIEFDRKGNNDAVFYDCENDKFTDFITSFGFVEEFGSFSDISEIAPHLNVAAVNLSSGYYNPHTTHEVICMPDVINVIERASQIIEHCNVKYDYEKRVNDYYGYSKGFCILSKHYSYLCNKCGACGKRELKLLYGEEYKVMGLVDDFPDLYEVSIAKDGTVYAYYYDLDVAMPVESAYIEVDGVRLRYKDCDGEEVFVEVMEWDDFEELIDAY